MPSILKLYGGRDNTLLGADSRNIVRRLERLELFSVLNRMAARDEIQAADVTELEWRATRRPR